MDADTYPKSIFPFLFEKNQIGGGRQLCVCSLSITKRPHLFVTVWGDRATRTYSGNLQLATVRVKAVVDLKAVTERAPYPAESGQIFLGSLDQQQQIRGCTRVRLVGLLCGRQGEVGTNFLDSIMESRK